MNGMGQPTFDPQPQCITALWMVLISRPTKDRRLSELARAAGYMRRWCAHTKMVMNPSTSRPIVRQLVSDSQPLSHKCDILTTRLQDWP